MSVPDRLSIEMVPEWSLVCVGLFLVFTILINCVFPTRIDLLLSLASASNQDAGIDRIRGGGYLGGSAGERFGYAGPT